jgi:type IV pilus assembly protein PilA
MSTDGPPKKTSKAAGVIWVIVVAVVFCVLAAIGWTKFQAIRARSQDMAVAGNLRHLVQGAEQYFTDHSVSSITFKGLVGTNPSQYVKTFTTVAQETYSAVILQATAVTASGIAGARTITYAP